MARGMKMTTLADLGKFVTRAAGITRDVFEHLLNPRLGFAEIARTLRPG